MKSIERSVDGQKLTINKSTLLFKFFNLQNYEDRGNS
jgi:hypothetical protein